MLYRPTLYRPTALRFCLATALVAGVAVSLAGPAAAATTIRVPESQLQTCPATPAPTPPAACDVVVGGGTAAVVDAAPSAVGRSYLRLSTPASSDKATVYGVAQGGVPLSAITTLGYRTLIETPGSGNAQQAPSINIEINPHKAGATYATLVWEPIYTGTHVATGAWQTWSPSSTPTGSGGWWSTRADPLTTGAPNKWGFNSYTASFADVKAALPDATVLGVSVNQGSGSTGLVAGVDRFTVNDTVYDFENPPPGPPSADLSIAVAGLPANAPVGSPLTITITVRNAGPTAATQLQTYFVAPFGLRITSATPDGTTVNGTAILTTPTLASGATATYTLRATVTAPGPKRITAYTRAKEKDPNNLNNLAQPTLP